MPDIDLQIDELVLHGFPAADRAHIGDAVRAELQRALAQLDPARFASTGAIDAGSFTVSAGARPQALGAQIAQRIVGGLR